MNRFEHVIDSLGALLLNPGTGVLIGLLVVAAWIDWRTMRIPNWLTVGGMCWGLLWNTLASETWYLGLASASGGLVVGLFLFLPLWLLRAMGAGDVKLMALVGAFLGAWAVFKAAIIVGVVGGVAVLLFAAFHRSTRRLAGNLREIAYSIALPGVPLWRPGAAGTSIGKLPYGVSISIGTVLFLVVRQLGIF